MQHTFPTPEPVELWIEVGRGRVRITTADVDETTVQLSGDQADQVVVEHRGDTISVVAPRSRAGFLREAPRLDVEVVAPTGSRVATRTGSADLTTAGLVGELHAKSGSGSVSAEEVAGVVTADTGSGDVEIATAGSHVRAKSGSGDIVLGTVGGTVALSTGSGDVQLQHVQESGVVKTGSGDVLVRQMTADLTVSTGSGDMVVEVMSGGGLQAKSASGDVVVGVSAGIPVWTDISTISGSIRSDLAGAGEPSPGDPFLEIRATTVSGDIDLKQR